MDDHDSETLTRNVPYMVKHLDPQETVDHLRATGEILDSHVQKIGALGTQSDKVRELVTILKTRGPQAYSKFIASLKAADCGFIAEKLNADAIMHADDDAICQIHATKYDSFCFTEHIACCYKCHKTSSQCEVVASSDARDRLNEEYNDQRKKLQSFTANIASRISRKLSETENFEKKTLGNVDRFYKYLKDLIQEQEDMTRMLISETASTQRDELQEISKKFDRLKASSSPQRMESTQERIFDDMTGMDKIYRDLEDFKCLVSDEEQLSREIELKKTEASYEFTGEGSGAIGTIKALLGGLCEIRNHQEGAAEEPKADTFDGIKEFLEFRDISNWISNSDAIRTLTYINSAIDSDLILTTDKKIIRITEGGEVKYDAPLPSSAQHATSISIKGELIYIPVPDDQHLHVLKLADFSHVESVKAWARCRAVASISDNFVVGYEKPACLRLISRQRELKTYTFNNSRRIGGIMTGIFEFVGLEGALLFIRIPDSEDRIVVHVRDEPRVGVSSAIHILSADLLPLTTIKNDNLVNAWDLCITRDTVLVVRIRDERYRPTERTGSVMRFDFEGNFRGFVIEKLIYAHGVAYNPCSQHIAVLSEVKTLSLYKGHKG